MGSRSIRRMRMRLYESSTYGTGNRDSKRSELTSVKAQGMTSLKIQHA